MNLRKLSLEYEHYCFLYCSLFGSKMTFEEFVFEYKQKLERKKIENAIIDKIIKENEIIVDLKNYRKELLLHNSKDNTYLRSMNEIIPSNVLKRGCQVVKNYYSRLCRAKKFIKNMLDNYSCLFLTLTFNDKCLHNTTAETRRIYVRRFLKNYNTYALANIDFGSKNEREHYHCVVAVENVNHFDWSYGSINFRKIVYNLEDSSCITNYILKLAQHSVKDTTGGLMYIRPSEN